MHRALALLLLLPVPVAATAEDSDAAALALADRTPDTTQHPSDWHVFAEGAYTATTPRYDGATAHGQRMSLDVRYDSVPTTGWRVVFADRWDVRWYNHLDRENSVNTLKEAYVSWQARADGLLDAGRINARYGVATGYNPTDYFRSGAVRSIVSADPNSLRENRLGSAMLRGQVLWTGGSLAALYSPKIENQPTTNAFSPDWGATNNRARWLIAASQRLADHFEPQWLIYGEEHRAPQYGLNVTALVNDATVAYAEWSGGRSAPLLALATGREDDEAFHHRLAAGLTYTTPNKFSLTAEYQHSGAAADRAAWDALGRGPSALYWQYRGYVQAVQDLPTRNAVFLYGRWQDALLLHLDLTGMERINREDKSRFYWVEARYHWPRVDAALQWQLNNGTATSEYGALPERRIWSALIQYFL